VNYYSRLLTVWVMTASGNSSSLFPFGTLAIKDGKFAGDSSITTAAGTSPARF